MRHVKILGCLKIRVLKKMSGAKTGSEKRWKKYTARSFMIVLLSHTIIIIIIIVVVVVIGFVVSLCVVKKPP